MNGPRLVILAGAVAFGLAAVGRALREPSPRVTPPAGAAVRLAPTPQPTAGEPGRPGATSPLPGGPSGVFPVLIPEAAGRAPTPVVDPGGHPFTSQEGEPMTRATREPGRSATGPRILGITNGASRE